MTVKRLASMFLVVLVFAAMLLGSVNVAAYNPPSYSEVLNAYYQGLSYINNLKRVIYDPTTWTVKYKVIAEYPSIPVWGKLNDLTWIPPFVDKKICLDTGYDKVVANAYVTMSIAYERHYSDRSVWAYDYTFKYMVSIPSFGPVTYDLAHLRVVEEQRSDGYYTITVYTVSYTTAPAYYNCPAIDGGQIQVYIAGAYAGKIADLASAPWQSTYSSPLPSFRFSLRHVAVLGDLFYQAIGDTDLPLHYLVLDLLKVIWGQFTYPFDLYGNALYEYPVTLIVKDVVEEQFYDAHWFCTSGQCETGYDRMYRWAYENGYVDASSRGVFYPLYPYKSRIVAAAELLNTNGGTLFIEAISSGAKTYCGDEDPMYNAWKGIYYVATGQWTPALSQWYDILDNWDGVGVKACYSSAYSTVRLALAVMLGTLLAKNGYIDWGVVDNMVRALLKAQWNGSGYYKPEGGNWVYIYKNDHKGGFLVAYDVAPDGSFGSTPFRPGWTEILTEGGDMDPEYIGPLPTNAETTLAALVALKLYMDSRY